ncbi:hypothetical protein H7U34_06125 [Collinsella tanakaei]|nr:hypothetical protein [Collinsella tanakaei]
MSRLNLVERELGQLDGGSFQKLAEAYAYRKFHLKSIVTLGSQLGTNKPTKGTPDAHSLTDNEAILIPFTTAQCNSFDKLKSDIEECISVKIPDGYNRIIICCHLVWRLTPEQEGELLELDSRIELIGPKTIAMDLANEYHDLAADFLHIRMGVGALVTVSEWIESEGRKGFATPQSKPLRHRDGELNELEKKLDQVQILVLRGSSGSGKTRLALEAVKRYAEGKQIESYVLSQMRTPGVAEDINAFLSEGDAALLIDDAQQSEGLDAVLEAVVRNPGLRVILTVRDYAYEQLMHGVRRSVKSETYSLERLEDAAVRVLLQEDYEITSPLFLDKIEKIARGNLRIAIMAALRAKRGGYPGIESAYGIMDVFYDKLVSGLEGEDLILLSYLSVYAPCDLKEGDPTYDDLLSEGISRSSMERRARKLHDRNILDLLEGSDGTVAVKFEQLNLQDYCVYKAIFEEHIIDLRNFIEEFITRDRQKVVRVLNILISVFGDDATLSRIKSDCSKAWEASRSKPDDERREIMDVLHPLIPDEAYRFALDEVDGAAASPVPLSERGDYERQMVGAVPVSLAILCELRDRERYPDTLSTLLAAVEKGCFALGDYRSAIEGLLAITARSVESGFKYERALIDELARMTGYGPNARNLQFFGMKLCEQYLAFAHTSHEVEDGGSIRFITIRMPESEAALELRADAIAFLCGLLCSPVYRAEAARALTPHVGVFDKTAIEDNIRFFIIGGIKAFVSAIPAGYRPATRGERELVYHCTLACEVLSMPELEKVSVLLPEAYFDLEKLMESFGPDEREIASATAGWDVKRYEGVLRINREMWERGELDSYDAGSLIDRVVMSSLIRDDPSVDVKKIFTSICVLYDGDQEISLGPKIVERLAQRIGWRLLIDQAQAHGLSALVGTAIMSVPAEILTAGDLDSLICLAGNGQVLMRIDGVMDIELKSTGFAKRYCEAAKSCLLAKPGYACCFFLPLSKLKDSTEILDTCFGDNRSLLLEVYEANILLNEHFDYYGVLFRYLDEKGSDPIDCLFGRLESADGYDDRRKIIRRMGQASCLDNPEKRMREVVHRLVSCSKLPDHDVASLLTYNVYLSRGFDVLGFIAGELECGLEEGVVPEHYSTVLADIPFKDRMETYVDLLSKDPEGRLFEALPFGSSSYVGSGEEGFAPAYREEIEIIKSISKSLPEDSCYSYHRKRLDEIVCAKEIEVERERWRSFHESV